MTKNEICEQYGIYPHIDGDDETDWNRELTEKEAKKWQWVIEQLMSIVEELLSKLEE